MPEFRSMSRERPTSAPCSRRISASAERLGGVQAMTSLAVLEAPWYAVDMARVSPCQAVVARWPRFMRELLSVRGDHAEQPATGAALPVADIDLRAKLEHVGLELRHVGRLVLDLLFAHAHADLGAAHLRLVQRGLGLFELSAEGRALSRRVKASGHRSPQDLRRAVLARRSSIGEPDAGFGASLGLSSAAGSYSCSSRRQSSSRYLCTATRWCIAAALAPTIVS